VDHGQRGGDDREDQRRSGERGDPAVGGWYAVSLRPVVRRRSVDRQPFSTEVRT
jgi:hypothetical protein